MSVPTHVFREYDIRGLTRTELTPDFAEALGRGLAGYLLISQGVWTMLTNQLNREITTVENLLPKR